MRTTIYLENDETLVYSIALENSAEFNFGVPMNLPPEEVVRFLQAKEIWGDAQARLLQMLQAKQKHSHKWYRRFQRAKGLKKWIKSRK